MNTKNMVLVKGFDLFFSNLKKGAIKKIAMNLGGNYDFCENEKRATYFFEKIRLVEVDKLNSVHDIVNKIGLEYSNTYNCQFNYSELYLKVPDKSYKTLIENENLTILDNNHH